MKITKRQLRRIIREEKARLLRERRNPTRRSRRRFLQEQAANQVEALRLAADSIPTMVQNIGNANSTMLLPNPSTMHEIIIDIVNEAVAQAGVDGKEFDKRVESLDFDQLIDDKIQARMEDFRESSLIIANILGGVAAELLEDAAELGDLG